MSLLLLGIVSRVARLITLVRQVVLAFPLRNSVFLATVMSPQSGSFSDVRVFCLYVEFNELAKAYGLVDCCDNVRCFYAVFHDHCWMDIHTSIHE